MKFSECVVVDEISRPEFMVEVQNVRNYVFWELTNINKFPQPNGISARIGTIQWTSFFALHPNQNKLIGKPMPPSIAAHNLCSGAIAPGLPSLSHFCHSFWYMSLSRTTNVGTLNKHPKPNPRKTRPDICLSKPYTPPNTYGIDPKKVKTTWKSGVSVIASSRWIW